MLEARLLFLIHPKGDQLHWLTKRHDRQYYTHNVYTSNVSANCANPTASDNPTMAIEDRDWYREDPPRGRSIQPGGTGRSGRPRPSGPYKPSPWDRGGRPSRRKSKLWLIALVLILAVSTGEIGSRAGLWGSPLNAAIEKSHDLSLPSANRSADRKSNDPLNLGSLRVAPPRLTDVVRVRVTDAQLRPARYAGQVCLTIDGQRRVCASYSVGERPAFKLTNALKREGFRVQLIRE